MKANSKPLDKQTIKIVHADLDQAIALVLAKHGLKKETSRISYHPLGFTMKLEVVLEGSEAEIAAQKFAYDFERWGLKYGDTVTLSGGRSFTVAGFNKGAKMLVKDANGKVWLVKPEQVKKDGALLKDKWAEPYKPLFGDVPVPPAPKAA